MKAWATICVVVLVVAVAMPVMAGDKHACTASTDDCLKKMQTKMQAKGWLGVETEETDSGHWAVNKVYLDSPAAQAGFQAGDVLIALNGVEMSKQNKEAYKEAASELGPGSKVTYTIKREGGKKQFEVQLGSVPRELMAQWVGEHMLAYHTQVRVASK
jgi:C-terminal processing protease CtpA/Prc